MSKKIPVITVTNSDNDWAGMYIGDELVHQDHALRPHQILEILEARGVISLNYQDFSDQDEEHLDEVGTLPSSLKDLLSGKW